jgi:hypothetical protein
VFVWRRSDGLLRSIRLTIEEDTRHMWTGTLKTVPRYRTWRRHSLTQKWLWASWLFLLRCQTTRRPLLPTGADKRVNLSFFPPHHYYFFLFQLVKLSSLPVPHSEIGMAVGVPSFTSLSWEFCLLNDCVAHILLTDLSSGDGVVTDNSVYHYRSGAFVRTLDRRHNVWEKQPDPRRTAVCSARPIHSY